MINASGRPQVTFTSQRVREEQDVSAGPLPFLQSPMDKLFGSGCGKALRWHLFKTGFLPMTAAPLSTSHPTLSCSRWQHWPGHQDLLLASSFGRAWCLPVVSPGGAVSWQGGGRGGVGVSGWDGGWLQSRGCHGGHRQVRVPRPLVQEVLMLTSTCPGSRGVILT